jgi:hypothetical protein
VSDYRECASCMVLRAKLYYEVCTETSAQVFGVSREVIYQAIHIEEGHK